MKYKWQPTNRIHGKNDNIISVFEASKLVGIHPDTIYRAVARGENIGFPVIKAGRAYVVPKRPLYDLLGIEN